MSSTSGEMDDFVIAYKYSCCMRTEMLTYISCEFEKYNVALTEKNRLAKNEALKEEQLASGLKTIQTVH